MKALVLALLAVLLSALLSAASSPYGHEPGFVRSSGSDGFPLREAFDLYVRSVQEGDLNGLFSTVTQGEEMFFLTATGEIIDGREGYRRFHQEWFSETGWSMPVELLRVEEGKDLGHTLAVFRYREETPEGTVYHLDSYFTLLWRREGGEWKVVGDVCTPIERYYTDSTGERLYSDTQRQVVQTFHERRTVRRFASTPVPDEHLRIILNTARHAPTAGNQQPWKFLVVRDREDLNQLLETAVGAYLDRYRAAGAPGDTTEVRLQLERALDGALSAPVYVAVLADRESRYPEYAVQDATLAAGNLMNAARALGYGTGFFTTYFPEEVMRPFFDIPERYIVVCFTPVGIPEEWPDTPPKKPLEELVVEDRFGGS